MRIRGTKTLNAHALALSYLGESFIRLHRNVVNASDDLYLRWRLVTVQRALPVSRPRASRGWASQSRSE
ncbi:hypothetical protein HH1059_20400 [Halorhodospira halochloris]|uniref:Uncharacterized protein n=1 Tax=Halorhodospira halochloris TaxID=1052 RepID=A0A2Z6F037_HALHR|nr:hypothetical protein HH1059_20400 [Halorhodospira halochloris]